MSKNMRGFTRKVGLPPGTLIHIGEDRASDTTISILDYNEAHCYEPKVKSIEDLLSYKTSPTVTWVNVHGLSHVSTIEKIGNVFDIHPLIMEDILNATQRPKIDIHSDYTYIVLKSLYCHQEAFHFEAEQISILVGANYVITFQESERPNLVSIWERIKGAKGHLRKMGTDYLAYAIIDAIVDHYFVVLETLGEKIEDLEYKLLIESGPQMIQQIHQQKTELLLLRKTIWPIREIISTLIRGESTLFTDVTLVYIRDIYDHTIHIMDTIEMYRDIMSSMLDIYLSSVSNKLNEIMKVLTIMSSVFIPLTFLVGVYGMNFKYMPELDWEWGYPTLWCLMLLISFSMIKYLKLKKWM